MMKIRNTSQPITGYILLILPIFTSMSIAQFAGGTGEPFAPYQIATAEQLISMGKDPNLYGKHFVLSTDIDMDPNLPGSRVFNRAVIAPVSNDSDVLFQGRRFTGHFDGQGHTIRNLQIFGQSYLGLFGIADHATISNLGLWNVKIHAVDEGIFIGGLVGQLSGATITSSYCTGIVSGGRLVGGLAGCNSRGSITLSYSTCRINGDHEIGSLVGQNAGIISSSYSMGSVSGIWGVGGLVGTNCDGATITSSYSMGSVSGDTSVGGLVGLNCDDRVTSSFWDIETSGLIECSGGMGLSTVQMQSINTFLDTGWDFNDVWKMWDGYDYPRLQWEPGPNTPLVFVNIPGGAFEMGDHYNMGRPEEGPIHTVALDSFNISKYKTTNSQYTEYLNAALMKGLIHVVEGVVYAVSDVNQTKPYCDMYSTDDFSQIEYSQGQFSVRSWDGISMAYHPVVAVSWYGAKAFCDYYGYRLPTEAEWEYAARGGYHDPYYKYPWGSNTFDRNKLTFSGKIDYPYTTPVGYYDPQGAYGLCDMASNVWEWCQDWYGEDYYSNSASTNPTGPTSGVYRVMRGGNWNGRDPAYGCRTAIRGGLVPYLRRFGLLGFRVCRSLSLQN